MIRLIFVCAALLLPLQAAPLAAASQNASAAAVSLDEHVRTCRHYENRARFKARGPGAPMETRLADQCAAALAILRRGSGVSEARTSRARLYMERLTRLKATIIEINRDRIYGSDATRLALPRAGLARPIGRGSLVTPTGEYLIARHMGVLDALEAWSAGEEVLKASAAEAGAGPAGSAAQPVQPAEQPDG